MFAFVFNINCTFMNKHWDRLKLVQDTGWEEVGLRGAACPKQKSKPNSPEQEPDGQATLRCTGVTFGAISGDSVISGSNVEFGLLLRQRW